MNMSPLQRKFVIKQRIYSISVTLSRLILFLGFIGIWEFTEIGRASCRERV